MLRRAEIVVKGDVQEAGYRAEVFKIAIKYPLKGFVENLRDGRVKIICEGEKKVIENFIKEIDIKNEFITVKEIEKKFLQPKNEFKNFEVKVSDIAYELFQGFGTAKKFLKASINETRKVGEKVEKVGEKVDNVGKEVKASRKDIKAMHKDLGEKISNMQKDLGGKISNMHKDLGNKLDKETNILTEFKNQTGDNFQDLDKKYHTISKNMEEMNKNIAKLTDYIGLLIKDYFDSKKE